MSQEQREQLLQKAKTELNYAFGLGNDELARKWSFDVSQESIADAIAKRNLLTAHMNRYIHQFVGAGLWYMHGIIAGYLAEEKPDFITGLGKHVQFPVLAADEIEYCANWLYNDYGPRYAADQAKKVFDIYLGKTQGKTGSAYLGKYRFLWDEEVEQDNHFDPIDLGEQKPLDRIWRRYDEMPEAYKDAGRGQERRKAVLAGSGNAQLQEEAVEKLDFADVTLKFDKENEFSADAKSRAIEAYNEELDQFIAAKMQRAAEKEQGLIKMLEGGQALLASYYSEEDSAKIIAYQARVEEIERLTAELPGFDNQRLVATSHARKAKKKLAKAKEDQSAFLQSLGADDLPMTEQQEIINDQLVDEIAALTQKHERLSAEAETAVAEHVACQTDLASAKEAAGQLLADLRAARAEAIAQAEAGLSSLEHEAKGKERELEALLASDDVEGSVIMQCRWQLEEANRRCAAQRLAVHQAKSGSWALRRYAAEVGADRAKSRYWEQVKNLHEFYHADPAAKLGWLIGAVEPGANELEGVKEGIPVGTAAGLRRLVFSFKENSTEAWARRIPEILRKSGLTYVSATSDEQRLSEDDVQAMTKTIVDAIDGHLRSWCKRFEDINISEKLDAATRESLTHLQHALRRELYASTDLAKIRNLSTPVEKDNDMFGHSSLASRRYVSACKVVNTINEMVSRAEAEKESGINYRCEALKGELAAMGFTGLQANQPSQAGGGAAKPSRDQQAIQDFVKHGRDDYGMMLHEVAANAYKKNIIPFLLHLLKQGGKVGHKIHQAPVTAILFDKIEFAGSTETTEQCWNLFIAARIAEQIFETAAGAAWIRGIAESIIHVVAVKDQSLSDFYKERDIDTVEEILRRLVLELCLGDINGRTIWQSKAFQSLMNLWRYKALGFSTPQAEQDEAQRDSSAADSPERTYIVTLRYFQKEFMTLVKGLFASDFYQKLQGVRLLAEPSFAKRVEILNKDAKADKVYKRQATAKDVAANLAEYIDQPAVSGIDPEELREKIRREERAEAEKQARQQQQALEQENESIRKEMNSKIAKLEGANKSIQDQMGSKIAELEGANKSIQDQMAVERAAFEEAARAAEAEKRRQEKQAREAQQLVAELAKDMLSLKEEVKILRNREGDSNNQGPQAAAGNAPQPTIPANGSLANVTMLRQGGAEMGSETVNQHRSETDSSDEETAGAGR